MDICLNLSIKNSVNDTIGDVEILLNAEYLKITEEHRVTQTENDLSSI